MELLSIQEDFSKHGSHTITWRHSISLAQGFDVGALLWKDSQHLFVLGSSIALWERIGVEQHSRDIAAATFSQADPLVNTSDSLQKGSALDRIGGLAMEESKELPHSPMGPVRIHDCRQGGLGAGPSRSHHDQSPFTRSAFDPPSSISSAASVWICTFSRPLPVPVAYATISPDGVYIATLSLRDPTRSDKRSIIRVYSLCLSSEQSTLQIELSRLFGRSYSHNLEAFRSRTILNYYALVVDSTPIKIAWSNDPATKGEGEHQFSQQPSSKNLPGSARAPPTIVRPEARSFRQHDDISLLLATTSGGFEYVFAPSRTTSKPSTGTSQRHALGGNVDDFSLLTMRSLHVEGGPAAWWQRREFQSASAGGTLMGSCEMIILPSDSQKDTRLMCPTNVGDALSNNIVTLNPIVNATCSWPSHPKVGLQSFIQFRKEIALWVDFETSSVEMARLMPSDDTAGTSPSSSSHPRPVEVNDFNYECVARRQGTFNDVSILVTSRASPSMFMLCDRSETATRGSFICSTGCYGEDISTDRLLIMHSLKGGHCCTQIVSSLHFELFYCLTDEKVLYLASTAGFFEVCSPSDSIGDCSPIRIVGESPKVGRSSDGSLRLLSIAIWIARRIYVLNVMIADSGSVDHLKWSPISYPSSESIIKAPVLSFLGDANGLIVVLFGAEEGTLHLSCLSNIPESPQEATPEGDMSEEGHTDPYDPLNFESQLLAQDAWGDVAFVVVEEGAPDRDGGFCIQHILKVASPHPSAPNWTMVSTADSLAQAPLAIAWSPLRELYVATAEGYIVKYVARLDSGNLEKWHHHSASPLPTFLPSPLAFTKIALSIGHDGCPCITLDDNVTFVIAPILGEAYDEELQDAPLKGEDSQGATISDYQREQGRLPPNALRISNAVISLRSMNFVISGHFENLPLAPRGFNDSACGDLAMGRSSFVTDARNRCRGPSDSQYRSRQQSLSFFDNVAFLDFGDDDEESDAKLPIDDHLKETLTISAHSDGKRAITRDTHHSLSYAVSSRGSVTNSLATNRENTSNVAIEGEGSLSSAMEKDSAIEATREATFLLLDCKDAIDDAGAKYLYFSCLASRSAGGGRITSTLGFEYLAGQASDAQEILIEKTCEMMKERQGHSPDSQANGPEAVSHASGGTVAQGAAKSSPRGSPGIAWQKFSSFGFGFWVNNRERLRELLDDVARTDFTMSRDPASCAIIYLILGRGQLLKTLWKASSAGTATDGEGKRMIEFLSRDFSDDGIRTIAAKNAFAALGKQRNSLAVIFFILANRLNDALQVCIERLKDVHLAHLIAKFLCDEAGYERLISSHVRKNERIPICIRTIMIKNARPAEDIMDIYLVCTSSSPPLLAILVPEHSAPTSDSIS